MDVQAEVLVRQERLDRLQQARAVLEWRAAKRYQAKKKVYETFNTVGVDVKGQNLQLIDITVYSNGDEHYVTVKELEALEKRPPPKVPEPAEQERRAQIEQFVAEESYLNLPHLTKKQLQKVSRAFKKRNPERDLCPVLDRQFDGKGYFEFIDQDLQDAFVMRVKISRNSHETTVDPQTNQPATLKLKDVALHHSHRQVLKKLRCARVTAALPKTARKAASAQPRSWSLGSISTVASSVSSNSGDKEFTTTVHAVVYS